MKAQNRIVIAEDHTILREGLRALISSDPGLEIVAEARDGQEVVAAVDKLDPELVLMDLSMPRMNGLEAIEEICRRHPKARVLVLTVHKSEEYVQAALRAGAAGYILKDAASTELLAAIRTVLEGKPYLSPAISHQVIQGYLKGKREGEVITPWDTLTQREREVLKMIAEGHKNKEIADFFVISPKTVEKHRANLMKKLDLHSASEMTIFAMRKGLIES